MSTTKQQYTNLFTEMPLYVCIGTQFYRKRGTSNLWHTIWSLCKHFIHRKSQNVIGYHYNVPVETRPQRT